METQNLPSNSLHWVRGDCIGRGSFGTVSLALNKADARVFAAKSINLNTAHPSQIEALENEIQILRSLSSPFIVSYLGSDYTRESPTTGVHRNLLMEYMPGGSVSDASRAAKGTSNLDERVVGSYTRCILSALHYIHSRGIVHCDVKGKNVLLGSSPGVAKLADFGSAKRFSNERRDGSSKIVPRGSPLWMAPEVIRQEKQGPESDVWSLGCTMIEMISGKPGWKDCGVATVYQIGSSEESPEFPDELSELGCDFLDKCLKREPSERWTCEQLLKHPFVLNDSIAESSPRSVFDWCYNSEFRDTEEEEEESESEDEKQFNFCSNSSNQDSNFENLVISASGRVRELACGRGVIWESDGWEVVRLGSVASGCGEEGRGTNLEYSNSVDQESEGINVEYSEFMSSRVERRIRRSDGEVRWEYLNSGSWSIFTGGSPRWWYWGSWKAGSGCQHGFKKKDIAVVKHEKGQYNYCYTSCSIACCNCKLLLFFILINSYIRRFHLICCFLFLEFRQAACGHRLFDSLSSNINTETNVKGSHLKIYDKCIYLTGSCNMFSKPKCR